jgi:hypothetical protein
MGKRFSKPIDKSSFSKEPKGRARRIHDLESTEPPTTEETGFQAFVEAEAKQAGLSVDEWNEKHWPPLSEMPWAGGKERNKPGKEEELEALVANGLTAHSPLELLLIAICAANKVNPSASKEELESSVRQAKHCLKRTSDSGGQPPVLGKEEICRAIAQDYFAKTLGLRKADKKQTLSALLKAQLQLIDTIDTKDANDKAIRPYKRYFETHKDRLMARVSEGKFEDQRRKEQFLRALEALRDCGVDIDVMYIGDNWDTL